MRLLADENFPLPTVQALRQAATMCSGSERHIAGAAHPGNQAGMAWARHRRNAGSGAHGPLRPNREVKTAASIFLKSLFWTTIDTKMLLLRLSAMCVLPAISLLAQSTLAVVEKKAGKVGFYTVEGKRIGEVQTGAFPHEMVFSPDRRFLYVTDNGMLWMTDKGEGGNTITIIDVAARKKAGAIDLGS
jgi:hypothetical protein